MLIKAPLFSCDDPLHFTFVVFYQVLCNHLIHIFFCASQGSCER